MMWRFVPIEAARRTIAAFRRCIDQWRAGCPELRSERPGRARNPMRTSEGFNGKTALVTGAAGGMGLEVSRRLCAETVRVYGVDVRAPDPGEASAGADHSSVALVLTVACRGSESAISSHFSRSS